MPKPEHCPKVGCGSSDIVAGMVTYELAPSQRGGPMAVPVVPLRCRRCGATWRAVYTAVVTPQEPE